MIKNLIGSLVATAILSSSVAAFAASSKTKAPVTSQHKKHHKHHKHHK